MNRWQGPPGYNYGSYNTWNNQLPVPGAVPNNPAHLQRPYFNTMPVSQPNMFGQVPRFPQPPYMPPGPPMPISGQYYQYQQQAGLVPPAHPISYSSATGPITNDTDGRRDSTRSRSRSRSRERRNRQRSRSPYRNHRDRRGRNLEREQNWSRSKDDEDTETSDIFKRLEEYKKKFEAMKSKEKEEKTRQPYEINRSSGITSDGDTYSEDDSKTDSYKTDTGKSTPAEKEKTETNTESENKTAQSKSDQSEISEVLEKLLDDIDEITETDDKTMLVTEDETEPEKATKDDLQHQSEAEKLINADKNKNTPFVGLQYITEVIQSDRRTFICSLCTIRLVQDSLVNHLNGYRHKYLYFRRNHEGVRNLKTKKNVTAHARRIEKQYGRQRIICVLVEDYKPQSNVMIPDIDMLSNQSQCSNQSSSTTTAVSIEMSEDHAKNKNAETDENKPEETTNDTSTDNLKNKSGETIKDKVSETETELQETEESYTQKNSDNTEAKADSMPISVSVDEGDTGSQPTSEELQKDSILEIQVAAVKEEERSVSCEEGNPEDFTRVWIVGSSLVEHAFTFMKQATETDVNLGLQQHGAKILWQGKIGMCFHQLKETIELLLSQEDSPHILVLHLGDNDIGQIPVGELRKTIIESINDLKETLPGAIIVWSQLLPRLTWKGEIHRSALHKCRIRINSSIASEVLKSNGAYIRYPGISVSDKSLFSDGVDLTDKGIQIFLDNIAHGLTRFITSKDRVYPASY